MKIPMDAIGLLLDQLSETLPETRSQLRRLKTTVASQTRAPLLRNDVLLSRYRLDIVQGRRRRDPRIEQLLTLNTIRSESGIATVTVITKPYPCPGRCVYCPTEARAPKSYLTNEPAMRRAVRHDYDPYRQMSSRLEALEETGHATDKIELIIKGGTWSFYPEDYQDWFIQRCVEAANEFKGQATSDKQHVPCPMSHVPCSLEEAQRRNETAAHRIVGMTIETRPDYISEQEIRRLRMLGVTRVELGVQSLNERVLELIVRDHTTREVREATRLLREAGFKIAYHLMPNLPGATPEEDLETFRQLFADAAYRPDAMKIYPCVVIESAELYRWWQEGRHQPYDETTLIELLAQMKAMVPPYLRIERVIRDIPSTSIAAGCKTTNLRETVLQRLRERGVACRCIRCRQVRQDATGSFVLRRLDYDAGKGREVFLSFEDPSTDRLAAFLRLHVPRAPDHWWEMLRGAALIRELHTYGRHLALHDRRDGAAQHQGYGRRLLAEAERIAWEEGGCQRLAVIAGIGAREYYRRFGYELHETYMVKELNRQHSALSTQH